MMPLYTANGLQMMEENMYMITILFTQMAQVFMDLMNAILMG